jgi:uncharacterized protein involved in exopolysaccharide biosynthesis
MDPTAGIRGAFDTYSFIVKKIFRHWYWIIIGFVVAFGGSAAFAFTRADAYKSETLVQVDRAILTDFVEGSGVGAGDLKARIHQLTLSRTRLEQVATELNLYPESRATKSLVEVLTSFRDQIEIAMHGEDTFLLAFQHDDPRTAQAVTQRMAELFIQESSRTRTDRARTTSRVLTEQVDAILLELGRQEDELATFKEDHAQEVFTIERRRLGFVGPTPNVQSKVEPIKRTGPRIVIVGEAGQQLAALRLKRGEREAELRSLQPAAVAPNSPEAEELRAQINQLQQERSALRARFTDDYPDVVLNAQRIAGLQRRLQAALRPVQAAAGQQSARQMQLTQKIADLDIEIARIQREATRVVRPATPTPAIPGADPTKIAIPTPPPRPAVPLSLEEVDAQLTRLDGQVGATRGRYQAALARKYDADFALSVEAQQAAESVKVIDAADLPSKPFYPNRPKILTGGAGAGLVLGLALAFLFAVLDTRIFNESDLARAVDVPVLVSIPDYRA